VRKPSGNPTKITTNTVASDASTCSGSSRRNAAEPASVSARTTTRGSASGIDGTRNGAGSSTDPAIAMADIGRRCGVVRRPHASQDASAAQAPTRTNVSQTGPALIEK
jgi:hypothetical protein